MTTLNFLTLTSPQEAAAISKITPWLSAMRSPYPNLTIPYGMPTYVQTIDVNNSTDYMVKMTITNPYSMYVVSSNAVPVSYFQAGADNVTPVNVINDQTLISNMQNAIDFANEIPGNIVVNPRLLIFPGQFKFIWLYELAQVLCIDKELTQAGSFLIADKLYNYQDMVQMLTSNFLATNI